MTLPARRIRGVAAMHDIEVNDDREGPSVAQQRYLSVVPWCADSLHCCNEIRALGLQFALHFRVTLESLGAAERVCALFFTHQPQDLAPLIVCLTIEPIDIAARHALTARYDARPTGIYGRVLWIVEQHLIAGRVVAPNAVHRVVGMDVAIFVQRLCAVRVVDVVVAVKMQVVVRA